MERRGSASPARPHSLRLGGADPGKSNSPSPASEAETRQWTDDLEKYEEMTEYMKEVDEILDFIKPFPRSQAAAERTEAEPPRPRLDHLENLIRLVEQLKELKDRNSDSQQNTQYLKDQRTMRERRRKAKFTAETFDIPPPPPDPPKKHRPSLPFRKSSRSKSISAHEFLASERLSRKSMSQGKAKVSKWTKVKEAFRWEKATQLETRIKQGRSDRKEVVEESRADRRPLEVITGDNVLEPVQHRLKVPEKAADSPSPADSVLSGQISSCSSLGATSSSCLLASSSCLLASSGYSGEHSSGGHSHSSVHTLDLPRHLSHTDYFAQSLQELSSSSEEEKLNELITFSQMVTGDSCKSRSIYEEIEARRSKSLDGENILGPSSHLLHLSKESLQDEMKVPKQHKTPWGKVIDIIQTRKDSLKKRPKKRDEFKADAEAFSATIQPSWSSQEFHFSDDVSSPEDGPKDQRPKIEVTYEKTPQSFCQLIPRRLDASNMRPLTPVLTLTRPSTEELQRLPPVEVEEKTSGKDSAVSSPTEEQNKIWEQASPDEKAKMAGLPPQGRASRWGRVKKAFLTSAALEDLPQGSSSAPSSPLFVGSFFSDNESDEMSSGEWVEDRQDKQSEPSNSPGLATTFLQAEVQRNYADLEKTISREIEANAQACELVKSFTKFDEKSEPDEILRKPRESLSIPLPTLDDLSPEFKKKLDEWKKIKKTPVTPTTGKDEPPQGHFISKIGEWQRWRPGSSSHKTESHHFKHEHHLQEEFHKKLEEWQMLKSGKRSRSQSDRGNKDERDYHTPSPGLSRTNSKKSPKKTTSGKSSGAESLSGSLKEKEGRAGRKSQKEKDLMWLEKELHKIEREKLRLEREREKYMEREARLEQMKRTMGSTTPTQEVLIKTATGFFRFEGISQKFTKKLYEWEKARGIAPEASTFALLESASVSCRAREERVGLQRSKSVGSAIDTSSAAALSTAHHPSSLSLNDVDDLDAMEQANLLADAVRMSSEVDMEGCEGKDDDEPEALIVDVEDVVEETAALMADEPHVQGHVPVYSYAPTEVTQLIDSSGSDGEREVQVLEANPERRKSLEENVILIDQNINLLEELEVKEAICREIENDLENIEEKISDEVHPASPPKESLLLEGEHLKHSFLQHSEQQKVLVHDLVDNLRILHANSASSSQDVPCDVSQVIDLSSQLLSLAQKLETALSERNTDLNYLGKSLYGRRDRSRVNRIGMEKVWYSTDEEPSSDYVPFEPTLQAEPSLAELGVGDLPSLITRKVLELKNGLTKLKESAVSKDERERPKDLEEEEEEEEEEEDDDDDHVASYTVQVSRTGPRASVISISDNKDSEMKRRSSAKRLSLKITPSPNTPPGENLSPVIVTVAPSFLERRKSEAEVDPLGNRIEKSKTQMVCGKKAEELYDRQLKLTEQRKETKSPEVLKKKIKEKILEMHRMSHEVRPRVPGNFSSPGGEQTTRSDDDSTDISEDKSDESKVVVVKKNGKGSRPKKNLKARRITDTTIAYKTLSEPGGSPDKDDSDDVFLWSNKGFSQTSGRSKGPELDSSPLSSATPTFVFVPTTRKIISPVETDTSSSVISYVIDDIEPKVNVHTPSEESEGAKSIGEEEIAAAKNKDDFQPKSDGRPSEGEKSKSQGIISESSRTSDIGMPPLPNSPSFLRKQLHKEAAPSIRMMIAKYNQKITEQENIETSSGNASPVGWRSPVLDRRIKQQMEKFQKEGENALKHGGKFGRSEVQKSASAGIIRTSEQSSVTSSNASLDRSKGDDINLRGILKSSSTGTVKPSTSSQTSIQNIKEKPHSIVPKHSMPEKPEVQVPLALRALRIKQAKADFLSKGPGGQSWSSEVCQTPTSLSSAFSWKAPTDRQDSASEEMKIRNRLSHVSVGSESSFDDFSSGEDSMNLIKSASAGMINIDRSDLIRRKSDGNVEQPCIQKTVGSSSNVPATETPAKRSSKFGLSNIKSRFRKVKMRKAKEKESAVSTLCRQSLLLDVSRPPSDRLPVPASCSKSCPSSPVLERTEQRTDDGKKWIRFKSKDRKRLSTDSNSGDKG